VLEYQYHSLSLLLKTKHFCPAVNLFKSLSLFFNITLDFFTKLLVIFFLWHILCKSLVDDHTVQQYTFVAQNVYCCQWPIDPLHKTQYPPLSHLLNTYLSTCQYVH
jgi:hypothetical protein